MPYDSTGSERSRCPCRSRGCTRCRTGCGPVVRRVGAVEHEAVVAQPEVDVQPVRRMPLIGDRESAELRHHGVEGRGDARVTDDVCARMAPQVPAVRACRRDRTLYAASALNVVGVNAPKAQGPEVPAGPL